MKQIIHECWGKGQKFLFWQRNFQMRARLLSLGDDKSEHAIHMQLLDAMLLKTREMRFPMIENTNIRHEVRDNHWNNVSYRGDIHHNTNHFICCLEVSDQRFIDKKQSVCFTSPEKVMAGFLFCLILYKLYIE